MAEESELVVGVEYASNSGALSDFTRAFQAIPEAVDEVFQKVQQTGMADDGTWDRKGREIAARFVTGVQAGLAGFDLQSSIGEWSLKGAGLTKRQVADQASLVRELNAQFASLRNSENEVTRPQFTKGDLLGLDRTKQDAESVNAALKRLENRVEKLRALNGFLRKTDAAIQSESVRNKFNPIERINDKKSPNYGTFRWAGGLRRRMDALGVALPDVQKYITPTGAPAQGRATSNLSGLLKKELQSRANELKSLEALVQTIKSAPMMQDNPHRVAKAMAPAVEAAQPKVVENQTRALQQAPLQKITPGLRAEILRELVSGGSERNVASQFDLTRAQVRTVKRGTTPEQMADARDYAILEAIGAGGSQRGVAAQFGVGRGTVRGLVERNAELIETMRTATNASPRGQTSGEKVVDYGQKYYQIGLSLERAYQQLERIVEGAVRATPEGQQRTFEQRATDTAQRFSGRTQFDDREQSYAAAASDRVWREFRAVSRGSKGWGRDAQGNAIPTQDFQELLNKFSVDVEGAKVLDEKSLNDAFNQWSHSQNQGALFKSREDEQRRLNRVFGATETPTLEQIQAREAAMGGGARGFFSEVKRGFTASPNGGSSGQMIGQTARISLFYGVAYRALSTLQEAIAQVTKETLDYEAALTDLSVATQHSKEENEDLATSVANTAAGAGYFGSQGLQVAAQSIGLYGVAGADHATQAAVAEQSSKVAVQVARVAGSNDPSSVNVQLAGALRSFGYGIERLTQLQDMITYIARNTGQTQTELLGATSNIATLGQSAGFSPEQLMAIVAQVGTTTGQNPEATAGQFRQVLSRELGKVASTASQVFGIDTSKMTSVEQVLDAVAHTDRTQQQTNEFTSAFGKGGSQTVAMITLDNWDRIQSLASGAVSSQGIGEKTYENVMNNISNQFKVAGTEVVNLGTKLVESGILDWLGLLVKGVTDATRAVSSIVDLYNELPRPLRSIAAALTEMYVAAQVLSRLQLGGRFGSVVTSVAAGVAANPGRSARTAAGAVGGFLTTPMFTSSEQRALSRQVGATGIIGTGVNARSAGVVQRGWARFQGATGLSGAGTVGAIAGVAIAADQVTKVFQVLTMAGEKLEEVQVKAAAAVTASDWRDVAALAGTNSAELQSHTLNGLAVGDVANLLPDIFGSIFNSDEISKLNKIQQDALKRADEADKRQQKALQNSPADLFTDYSTDGINNALDTLSSHGYTAAERLNFLNDAMFRFSETTKQTGKDLSSAVPQSQWDEVAGDVGNTIGKAVGNVRDLRQAESDRVRANAMDPSQTFSGIGDRLRYAFHNTAGKDVDSLTIGSADLAAAQGALRDTVLDKLKGLSQGDVAALRPQDIQEITTEAQEATKKALKDWDHLPQDLQKYVMDQVTLGVRNVFNTFSGDVDSGNVSSYLDVLPALAQASGDETATLTGSRKQGDKANLDSLLEGRDKVQQILNAGGGTDDDVRKLVALGASITQARQALFKSTSDELDAMVTFAQSSLNDDDVAGRLAIQIRALKKESAQAWRNVQASRRLVHEAGVGDVYQYNYTDVQNAKQVQESLNAAQRQQAANNLAAKNASALAYISPGNSLGLAVQQLANTRRSLNSGQYTKGSVEYAQLLQQQTQQAFSVSQTRIEGVNANALAAIDQRDNLARIRQQITNAQRQLSLYASSDPNHGNLLDQIAQLEQQQREAVVSRLNAITSSKIAGKQSSLVQARAAVREAKRTLGIQLKGTEGYYTALAGLRTAQKDMADAERDYANTLARLGSDTTDPVVQARLDLEQAKKKLTADRKAGEGKDVRAQDRLDVKNARNSKQDAAFNQYISDLQTNEELGRISQSAYMSYLQAEHDRLSAIGKRTRQQQEELDQVDKLMKSAADQMNSQFNIGDIKLPTVYEVRRAVSAGSPSTVADYSNSNNVVTINGADFQQVVDWLNKTLGKGAHVTRALSSRKA